VVRFGLTTTKKQNISVVVAFRVLAPFHSRIVERFFFALVPSVIYIGGILMQRKIYV
jgi:hypothetical protein